MKVSHSSHFVEEKTEEQNRKNGQEEQTAQSLDFLTLTSSNIEYFVH